MRADNKPWRDQTGFHAKGGMIKRPKKAKMPASVGPAPDEQMPPPPMGGMPGFATGGSVARGAGKATRGAKYKVY